MNRQPDLDELKRREVFAREMGGADKVKRQHDGGRLTVRERIALLVDPGSFHEVGAISGKAEYDPAGDLASLTPANCVFGRGLIDGRPVVVVGDDFTVRGGSADASIAAKPLMAEEMASEFRLPIVRVIEGSGGGGSVKTIETTGASNLPGGVGTTRGFHYMTANMAQVPVVALGLGSVAGLGAARLVASHYSIMTKSSAMFVAGPTAPRSGMEHMISHLLEMAAGARGQASSYHGTQVGVATLVAAATWARVRRAIDGGALGRPAVLPDPDQARDRITAAFKDLDETGAMAAECFADYSKKLRALAAGDPLARLRDGWERHDAALGAVLGEPAVLAAALRAAGLPDRFGALPEPVDDELARWAVASSPLQRARFSVTDLAMLLGCWEDGDVDEVLAAAGVLAGPS